MMPCTYTCALDLQKTAGWHGASARAPRQRRRRRRRWRLGMIAAGFHVWSMVSSGVIRRNWERKLDLQSACCWRSMRAPPPPLSRRRPLKCQRPLPTQTCSLGHLSHPSSPAPPPSTWLAPPAGVLRTARLASSARRLSTRPWPLPGPSSRPLGQVGLPGWLARRAVGLWGREGGLAAGSALVCSLAAWGAPQAAAQELLCTRSMTAAAAVGGRRSAHRPPPPPSCAALQWRRVGRPPADCLHPPLPPQMGSEDQGGASSSRRGPLRGRRGPATPAQRGAAVEPRGARLSEEEEAALLASAELALEGGRALGRGEALALARHQVCKEGAGLAAVGCLGWFGAASLPSAPWPEQPAQLRRTSPALLADHAHPLMLTRPPQVASRRVWDFGWAKGAGAPGVPAGALATYLALVGGTAAILCPSPGRTGHPPHSTT